MRKHLKTLLEDELIYVTPKLGSIAGAGELVYHLAVTGKVSVGDNYRGYFSTGKASVGDSVSLVEK